MKKFRRLTVILLAICLLLSGCAGGFVDTDNQDFLVKTGQWGGAGDTGNFNVVFTVGTDRVNIFILTYAVPCGDRSMYVMPSKTTKINVTDHSFSGEVEQMTITGKFIDKKHVEGTWQTRAHEAVPYSGEICESAQGTWKGTPD